MTELRRSETIDDLMEVVGQQNAAITALGDIVKNMDARLRLLTDLLDSHQRAIQQLTGITPKPPKDPLWN
jgi:hypothetical protein